MTGRRRADRYGVATIVVVTLAALVCIVGFMLAPFNVLDDARWQSATGLSATIIALVAFVISVQNFQRFSGQVRREDAELLMSVAQEIVKTFSAWPGILIRLHVIAGQIFEEVTQAGQDLFSPEAIAKYANERDIALLQEVHHDVERALDSLLGSSITIDYVKWVSDRNHEWPLRGFWLAAMASRGVPQGHESRVRYAPDQGMDLQLAAMRRELDAEQFKFSRAPSEQYVYILTQMLVLSPLVGKDYAEAAQRFRSETGSSPHINFLAMGPLLGTHWTAPYVINYSAIALFLYWLWPEEADLKAYLEHRFESVVGGEDFMAISISREAAFGPMLSLEARFLTRNPHLLIAAVPDET